MSIAYKTLEEWHQWVIDYRLQRAYRVAQEQRDRTRRESAERIVRAAIRRLASTGTHLISERLLSVPERIALYELDDQQCYRLEIGQCERCKERQFYLAGEMAEMYNPNDPDQPSQLLHADCTPEGWDTA